MKTNYKVRYDFAGFAKGDVIAASDFPAGTNVPALVESQFLSVDNVEDSACPACIEQGMKRPPKFGTMQELHDHYEEKHPGLVLPTEDDLDLEGEAEPNGEARTD